MANGIFGEKALIVSRVSTTEQVLSEGFSPQQNDLLAYAKTLGYNQFYTIDCVESGFLDMDVRDGWREIFSYLETNNDCKTIIATEINRLARDESVLMGVKQYLYDNHIQLIIKDLRFFLLNPDGEKSLSADLLFNIYTSMAHFEMLDKRDRMFRALREYRKVGYSIGGKELFGYTRICDGKLKDKKTYIVNEEQKKQIETIFQWYAYGIDNDLSITSLDRITQECIAKGFDKYLHSRRNVNKCLKEEAYVGYKVTSNYQKNKEYWNYKKKDAPKYIKGNSYECVYPQIIDKALFNKVQERMSKRNTHNALTSNNEYVDKSSKHITILSKILTCPCCNKFMVGEYRIKEGLKKHTYRCTHAKSKVSNCDYHNSLSMVNLDSSLWAFLKSKVSEIRQKKNQMYASISQEELEIEIENLEKNLSKYEEDYEKAENIYSMMFSRNKEKALIDFDKRLKEIDRKKCEDEELIDEKKLLLKEIQSRDTDDAKEKELEENIDSIKKSKKDIYKYMHLLVKAVKPLFVNRSFTVLEVIAFDNLDDVLNYSEEDVNGLPKIKSDKHDNIYYICIDKHDTNRIKIRLINDNLAFWSNEGQYFFIKGSENKFSVSDIFNIDIYDTNNRCDFSSSIELLDYEQLDVYDEDAINKTIKEG